MAYSKNANVSLKQSDLSHFISGLVYHQGKKLNDALLIPVCVANLWPTEFFGAKPLYAYTIQTDWKPITVHLIWFMNRLETRVCLSNIIYESSGGQPPYIYDLWMSQKLTSVYLWFMNRLETVSVYIRFFSESVRNQPVFYDLWIDWRPASICIWFLKQLENEVYISNMVYESVIGRPPYAYDLWIDWKLVSVYWWFMNNFFSWIVIDLYKKILKRNHWIFLSRLLCWKTVSTHCTGRETQEGHRVQKLDGCNNLGRREVPLS